MNARGETSGVPGGGDHVVGGASLATKAEAPASRAPKSCSSPAYIVSTTMPVVVALRADLLGPGRGRCRRAAARR